MKMAQPALPAGNGGLSGSQPFTANQVSTRQGYEAASKRGAWMTSSRLRADDRLLSRFGTAELDVVGLVKLPDSFLHP